MKSTRRNRLYRQLIASTLLIGGAFNLAVPVLAQTASTATAAGTAISNTATATYIDPNNPTTTLGASSNTVTITVAEVAGITITNAGVTDQTPADPVKSGDTLFYDYVITNVGNDPTTFRIPNAASITGPGTVSGNLEVDQAGGTTFTAISGTELITGKIQPGASVRVRVPVSVNVGATSGTITVTLGDTSPANGQNVPYVASGGSVHTIDDNTAGGTPILEVTTTSPANGEREASNTQNINVNTTSKLQAFASIFKTRSNYNAQSTTSATDDVLTYGLSLRVENSAPIGSSGYAPADLQPVTSINIGTGIGASVTSATAQNRILVSDAIPANTRLTVTGDPGHVAISSPAGWTAVYAYSNTTGNTATNSPLQDTWSTTAPTTAAEAATVKRIGFVYNGSIAKGSSTVTGFSFSVVTTGASNTGSTVISNMAQVIGQTTAGANQNLVYDESGDQNPSNFNDDGLPGTDSDQTPTQFNNTTNNPTHTGVANPATQDIDTGNDNTATGSAGGEVNVYTINGPGAFDILLGSNGAPGAVGPTSNNDDFTNKTTQVPPGTDTATDSDTLNPAAFTFTNTVQNNSGSVANISIRPTNPADLNVADLPTGATVTISASNGGTVISKTYVWDGTNFLFGNTVGGGSPIDTAVEVLTVSNVAVNGTAQYNVEIDLPANTELSPDRIAGDDDGEAGYPFSITAFVDGSNGNTTDGVIQPGEAQNITIDRLYVGFLRLLKESRILQGTGPAVLTGQGNFSTDPKTPAPGNIIEYRITYSNISSSAGTGSNNVILNASNIAITENGTVAPNNWAKDQDLAGTPGFNTIDTSNVVNSASDSSGAQISFFSGAAGTTPSADVTGTTQATDVTAYQVSTGSNLLGPGTSNRFRFQRQVND